MKAGFVLPEGSVTEQVERAVAAEAAGWDAIFVWEGAYHPDAWCLLSAMAIRTSAIKLGTMLTPLAWRRPWELAAQAPPSISSGGRVILTVASVPRRTAGRPGLIPWTAGREHRWLTKTWRSSSVSGGVRPTSSEPITAWTWPPSRNAPCAPFNSPESRSGSWGHGTDRGQCNGR